MQFTTISNDKSQQQKMINLVFNENIMEIIFIYPLGYFFFGRVSISKTAHCIIVMCIYICHFSFNGLPQGKK